MVVVMGAQATDEQVAAVVDLVEEAGGETFVSRGKNRTIVGLLGDTERFMALPIAGMPGVDQVVRVGKPYKLVAAESRTAPHVVQVGNVAIARD
ncbi:MAG: 3-deoxy-7-phosphoheptulonate synthase, partial [Actinobacteria bacterium]